MSRVLVTGANGFIGRAVLRRLAKTDHEVFAVTSQVVHGGERPTRQGGEVRWARANLLEVEDVERLCEATRADVLVHLAWCAKPGSYWTSPENHSWVSATLNLLGHFRHHGGKAAVIAGTCAEYDLSAGILTENVSPLKPETLYGESKLICGDMCANFSELHHLPVAWGRIFQAYGPGEACRRLLPSLIAALTRGEAFHCTEGRQVRDFIHVDDVARALLHLVDHRLSGAFNLGTGVPTSLREAVEYLSGRMGRPELVHFGALPTRPDEPAQIVANIDKIQATGWQPRLTLSEGLDDMLREYDTPHLMASQIREGDSP
jgi:UDP-glucuronate decarboxylase